MTEDDQANCHFEPKIGTLYDHSFYYRKKGKEGPSAEDMP
jgi:hypothetical protein